MKTNKKRNDNALLMLRCINTYAGFAIEKFDEANPIDDELLAALRGCKEYLGNIIGCLFERKRGGDC